MPGREYLALKDLHIAGDITIYHILDLKIKKEINKHSQLNVIGIITDKTKREFIEKLNCESRICLSYGENQVLFKGIPTQVEVTTHEGVHYVTLAALSDSYALDQKLKKRSFKRDEETYENVIREVGKDYRGFDFIGQKAVQNKLEGYLVQYEETDFEFIKRLASRINLPVIVEDTDNKPRFFIGLPQTDKITELKEEAYKETAYFREYETARASDKNARYETEFRGYILESQELLNIGQTVSYRNRKLVVTRMTSQLIKGLLINQYEVLPSKKTKPIPYFNTKIKGVSIKGEVTSVKETKVKVKLSIDTNQVENWYTYGTAMADAMYCMPYVGDQVKVHFLEKDERKALATLSVYEGVGLHPDTKFWSNKQGKKVEFTPSSLEFQAKKDILNNKELFMKMSHQEGLEIKSDHSITLACDGVLSLKAHTINMIAPEAVHLCTQANSRMVPLGINRKGLCLNPTSVNFETKRNAIIKGREKQSFPFEEEPRPTLRQKSSQVSLKPVPKAPPKKKSKWGKFFKGLAIGVAAVAAVAVAVAVCVAAAPVVAGLLAGGTASILLGGAMAVGLAAGTATTAIGSGYMTAGAIDVMKGEDSENANQQVDKGLAFISSGFGIIMTTATFGMAAVPMAAYADNIMASYLDMRIVPGKGIYAKMPGKIIGTPSIDKQTTYTNPIMRADYMHTTTNDKYFGLTFGNMKTTTFPSYGNTSLMPYANTSLMSIGSTGAYLPNYTPPNILFTAQIGAQGLVQGSNPRLLPYTSDNGLTSPQKGLSVPKTEVTAIDELQNKVNGNTEGVSKADKLKLSSWKYSPDEELYLKYKDVFDNPKYYNQTTGEINWPGQHGDKNIDGFLNGKFDEVTLKPGERIDRYGSDYGSFASPEGISYGQRALAPGTDLKPYSVFEVVKPMKVKSGDIAPWFNETGGGIQYVLPDIIDELLDAGIIRRVR